MGGAIDPKRTTQGGLFTRPVLTGGWAQWTDAAIEAARAGMQKSVDAAVLVGAGGGPPVAQSAALRAGVGKALRPVGLSAPTTRPRQVGLATQYAFGQDMQLALVRAGLPQHVAGAFAAVAQETFQKWGAGFDVSALADAGGPVLLAKGGGPAAGLLLPNRIAAEIRQRLGAEAAGPEVEGAIARFATWLSSSLSRFAAGATLDARAPKLISGPRF